MLPANSMNRNINISQAGLRGFVENWQANMLAGFLVFLIALPLCLGISLASGYPAIAGIFTAIVGGLVTPFLSNSELTIKGPAAGLIVVAIGCVQGFGYTGGHNPSADLHAYQLALGVGVGAAILQIGFGLLRAGAIGEFFPAAAVHGMLAAIGIIIVSKQIHILLGVTPHAKEPLSLLAELPQSILKMNPEVALIGILSLVILFGFRLIKNRYIRMIPAPMVVIILAVTLGIYFNLNHAHLVSFFGQSYDLGPSFLVNVPNNLLSGITLPDFSGVFTLNGVEYMIMFALIGSLESTICTKAVELIDPWQRKTNLNRDLLAIGVGNFIAAFLGGLPMISEIVRSKANVDNGARNCWANWFHGFFLLLFIALIPGIIHMIPLAALAAMLVYTGYRLASPHEFVYVYQVGREQLLIFCVTIVAVLATNLLLGIAIGLSVKIIINLLNGASLKSLFYPQIEIKQLDNTTYLVKVKQAIVFSNWYQFRRQLEGIEINYDGVREIILDLSETRLLDHTVVKKLHEFEREELARGHKLSIRGLDLHRALSKHPHAAKKNQNRARE